MQTPSLLKQIRLASVGDAVAIVSNEVSLTYDQLLQNVDLLAAELRQSGLGQGHIVLGYIGNVPAFIVTVLACRKVGCTFAPLDEGLRDAEMQTILTLTESDIVVCEQSALARCSEFSSNTLSVDASGKVLFSAMSDLPQKQTGLTAACIQFSSGSTGSSKAILLSEEAFYCRSFYLQQALALDSTDRTLCTLPLSHTHGLECLALPTLLAGGTLYLRSPKLAFPMYILEELEQQGITFFSSIPQFYDFAVKLDDSISPDLSSLRHPFCGSAALALSTAEKFHQKYGVHIKQGYGLAELSVICINRHDSESICYDSIGEPIDGIEWSIGEVACDGKGGMRGELLVRSKSMFDGYLKDYRNTSEKLKDGWLHTGDIVTVDKAGRFRVVGRKEDFIKVNGFKVYSSEIENVLVGHSDVMECAVVADKDELGVERVAAYLVLKDGHLKSKPNHQVERILDEYLAQFLSDYKLPKRYQVLEKLPKNALGKILKAKIQFTESDRAVA